MIYDNRNTRAGHNTLQAHTFDEVAHIFDTPIAPDIWERMETIVSTARITNTDAILDCGTGTGALLPIILKHKPRIVTACDLSEQMLKRARERFGDQVFFHHLDVMDLPYKPQSIDVVIFNACFGNLYDQKGALDIVATMLRSGGRIIISHPMGRNFSDRLKEENPMLVPYSLPDLHQSRLITSAIGLTLTTFIDEPLLYILQVTKD